MKKLIMIFACMLVACSSDDNEKESQNNIPQEDSLIGTWELIESYGSDGSNEGQWIIVQEQLRYTYTFKNNNTFTRSSFECEGNYNNDPSDFLLIDFNCSNNVFSTTYAMIFENHNLILTPNPMTCDEECKFKFKKISSN